MSGDVLLLNADYNVLSVNPLSTISWQNAMKLQFTDAIDIIDYYDEWVVHSAFDTMPVPSVIALKEYRNFNRRVKFTLKNLFLRDDYTCQYCQEKFHGDDLTKDHVKPRSLGGKPNWENIVSCCSPCNHRRGNAESIRPIRAPFVPSIREINAKIKNSRIHASHESWVPFLEYFWDSENIEAAYRRT